MLFLIWVEHNLNLSMTNLIGMVLIRIDQDGTRLQNEWYRLD